MKVIVSYFDGVGTGLTALKAAGIPVSRYLASEIDPGAISVAMKNHPEIEQMGDIRYAPSAAVINPDIIIAGSPCQGFSMLGNKAGLKHHASKLFYNFADELAAARAVNPDVKFLLENIKMKRSDMDTVSSIVGCRPHLIDSKYFVPQLRARYWWTNIEIGPVPELRTLDLEDIMETGANEKYCDVPEEMKALASNKAIGRAFREARSDEAKRLRRESMQAHGRDWCPYRAKVLEMRPDRLMNCLTAGFTVKQHSLVDEHGLARRTTPLEWERLQGLPDGYTDGLGLSDSARYSMLGDRHCPAVAQWIFSHLK